MHHRTRVFIIGRPSRKMWGKNRVVKRSPRAERNQLPIINLIKQTSDHIANSVTKNITGGTRSGEGWRSRLGLCPGNLSSERTIGVITDSVPSNTPTRIYPYRETGIEVDPTQVTQGDHPTHQAIYPVTQRNHPLTQGDHPSTRPINLSSHARRPSNTPSENMVDDERYLAVEMEGLGSDVRSPSVRHPFLKWM